MTARILIVEDNASIVKLVQELLQNQGYEVEAAVEPNDVFHAVASSRPDLVLMDVNLPESDGLTLTRELKTRHGAGAPKIVAFTALAMKEDQERAIAAGCDGYLSKPIHIKSFVHSIQEFLNQAPVVLDAPVALPTEPAADERVSAQPPPHPIDASRTVLVVDDNPSVVNVLSAFLQTAGYRVARASCGAEALQMLESVEPDLVVVDVTMPGMSGIEVCRRIKADDATRYIPVVVLTGHHETAKRLQCVEAGADAFVHKPFNKAELLTHIRALLRTRTLRQDLIDAHRVLRALANAVEARDLHARAHAERVAELSERLGRAAGLSRVELNELTMAATLHDIGNVEVPEVILNKPGALDPNEWSVVRRHPRAGAGLLRPVASFSQVATLVAQHHEHLDGSGYPGGLKGDQILTGARILSIAEVYDALTHRRAFREAFSRDRALEVLAEEARRGWWDLSLVRLITTLPATGSAAS